MTTRLGIAVRHLGASQLNFEIISQANDLVGSRMDVDVVGFFEEPRQACFHPAFATMQMMEGWGYEAPIVATTFTTAEKLLRFPACPRRMFYVHDLEWLRGGQRSYEHLRSVYASGQLLLIARSDDHRRLLEQLWNRPVAAVMPSFDIEQLLSLTDG